MWINLMCMKNIILKKNIQKNILRGNYGHFCELVEMTKKIEFSKF